MPGESGFTVLSGMNNIKPTKCLNAWSLIFHPNVKDKPSRTADLSHNCAIYSYEITSLSHTSGTPVCSRKKKSFCLYDTFPHVLFFLFWWILLLVIITIFSIKSQGQTTPRGNIIKADETFYQHFWAKTLPHTLKVLHLNQMIFLLTPVAKLPSQFAVLHFTPNFCHRSRRDIESSFPLAYST